jgi:hypothetical protein
MNERQHTIEVPARSWYAPLFGGYQEAREQLAFAEQHGADLGGAYLTVETDGYRIVGIGGWSLEPKGENETGRPL